MIKQFSWIGRNRCTILNTFFRSLNENISCDFLKEMRKHGMLCAILFRRILFYILLQSVNEAVGAKFLLRKFWYRNAVCCIMQAQILLKWNIIIFHMDIFLTDLSNCINRRSWHNGWIAFSDNFSRSFFLITFLQIQIYELFSFFYQRGFKHGGSINVIFFMFCQKIEIVYYWIFHGIHCFFLLIDR